MVLAQRSQLTELVEVLMYAVSAERLYDGEDVVRCPSDDERQQNGAEGLSCLLFLSTFLPTLTRPQSAAALGRSRCDPSLHPKHHRFRGIGQPAPDQRDQGRRLSGDRRRRRRRWRFLRGFRRHIRTAMRAAITGSLEGGGGLRRG